MGELSEQNWALAEREGVIYGNPKFGFTIGLDELNRLLDAARTEGRGEGEPVAWRPEVRAFADLMERTLRANDRKGGWKNCDANWLRARCAEELGELTAAILDPENHDVGREAADVANFAMMIADVFGALGRPLYASPIREPEISRTELIKLLTGFLVATEDGWPLHDDATPADVADAILNLAHVGGRGEPDEVTEDALLTRAKALIQHKGWKPGDKFSAWNVAQLMVAFGLDLTRQPETARCGHPDCGCDFDAICDAALPPPPQEQGGMK